MEIATTKCCAIMEIHNLSVHATPEEAMDEFCKLNIVTVPLFGPARNIPNAGSIYAFYLFTAACNKDGGPLYSSGKAYGKEFANFIKTNGLGKVWESPVKHNKVFHETHHNQIWIWDVDHDALKTWWSKRKASKTATVKKTSSF
jgi:hypothetical protein